MIFNRKFSRNEDSMATKRYCLKIEIMPNGERVRYCYGPTKDIVSLPKDRAVQPTHITCTKMPGDTRAQVEKHQAVQVIRNWREDAIDVIVIDHRKAIQEITLPSGIVLDRNSNLLLMVKAFQQWQKGEMVLAMDDALALKVWIADRVPFGMGAVESIKDMTVLNDLQDI